MKEIKLGPGEVSKFSENHKFLYCIVQVLLKINFEINPNLKLIDVWFRDRDILQRIYILL